MILPGSFLRSTDTIFRFVLLYYDFPNMQARLPSEWKKMHYIMDFGQPDEQTLRLGSGKKRQRRSLVYLRRTPEPRFRYTVCFPVLKQLFYIHAAIIHI